MSETDRFDTEDGGESDLAPSDDLPLAAPGRYQQLRLLGWGGMGEVWLARDELLEREVALKVLHAAALSAEAGPRRFWVEAQLQARLQHPDIVPLYDFGRLPADRRPFFTMRVVRGRSLREVCAAPATEGPELRRRVEVLRRVAEAIAYAHQEGLLHRDLKPHNVMLGDNGEVTVVDWGIGGPLKGAEDGDLSGTLPYMAPEAREGARPDERVDVYGLGATLLHAVTGRMPDPDQAIQAQIPAELPEDLATLIRAATVADPAERTPSAAELARSAQRWLDGAREREQALDLVAEALERLREMRARQAEAGALEQQARALASTLRPWASIEDKRPLWALEARAERLRDEANLDEVAVLETLAAALQRAPGLREAREVMADVHRARHAEAEEAGDARAAARAEKLLRAADTGRHARWLSGEGALTLLTDPPGAEVHLHKLVEQDRRLVPVFVESLGPTPLVERSLARGSWLLTLYAPGRALVRYPVAIGRNEHWDGVPPGQRAPLPVTLPRADELGPDDVYVPAGPSWLGGDARAPRSLPRQRVWVDAFIMRRFPVTNAEYLAFLNDLVARGRDVEAEGLVPGRVGGEASFAPGPEGVWRVKPDAENFELPLDWPVVLVDWHMAHAFAGWCADRSDRAWRLPFEVEWERAARGVDGRIHPWGGRYDATSSRISESDPHPLPVATTDYPLDESIWGARGLAGNALCWCADAYQLEGPAGIVEGRWVAPNTDPSDPSNRVIRGAGYTGTSLLARSATRHPYVAVHRSEIVGIRLVRAATPG